MIKRNTVVETKSATVLRGKQLRGQALKDRIFEAVHELISEQGTQVDPSRVSMKAIANQVPCSRTTLLKYEPIVENALKDVGCRLARRTGEVRAEALVHRVELYKEELKELRAELSALRNHHVDIYGRLLMGSGPVSGLIRDSAMVASYRDGRCVLCGGGPPSPAPNNIVEITKEAARALGRKKIR